jgi:small subunit ribosomal protein S6
MLDERHICSLGWMCLFCRYIWWIRENAVPLQPIWFFIIIKHLKSIMNQYETVFILTPVLSDVQMKEAVEKFKGILAAEGAEIINEENWGMKKLAYPIEKKSTGFYQLLEFKAEPTVIDKLELNFRRDERVIRYITVKLDKYAAEYAAKRKSVKQAKAQEA